MHSCFPSYYLKPTNHCVGATLLVYKGNIICVGPSSLENVRRTFARFDPVFINCLNTPANLAAEREQVRRGSISAELAAKVLNYTILADGTVVNTRKWEKLQQQQQQKKRRK